MNITKEFLEEQYIRLGKSSNIIAKETGNFKYTITNSLKKYNIKMRSLQESRRPKESKNILGCKWCPSCKLDKPFSDFCKNKRNCDGLDSYCRSCSSIKSKRFFPIRNKERQLTKAGLILSFGNKCSICGAHNLPIASYVFHHHSEKMDSTTYISPNVVLTSRKSSLVLSERNKWVLLCANCHNLVHSDCKLTASKIIMK